MIIYTCITNNKDNELPSIPIVKGCKYIYFSDKDYKNKDWEHRPLWFEHVDPRRVARWHKVNSHLLFPVEEFVLWVDGNIIMDKNPLEFKKLLEATDLFILTMKHPIRNCLYEEFRAVHQYRLDDYEVLRKQENKYLKEGMPRDDGLPETCVFLRKHTKKCEEFNESWWNEIKNYSKRDQLSITYVLWKMKEDWLGLPHSTIKKRHHSLPTTKST